MWLEMYVRWEFTANNAAETIRPEVKTNEMRIYYSTFIPLKQGGAVSSETLTIKTGVHGYPYLCTKTTSLFIQQHFRAHSWADNGLHTSIIPGGIPLYRTRQPKCD